MCKQNTHCVLVTFEGVKMLIVKEDVKGGLVSEDGVVTLLYYNREHKEYQSLPIEESIESFEGVLY